jgi:hypothetical protein
MFVVVAMCGVLPLAVLLRSLPAGDRRGVQVGETRRPVSSAHSSRT